MKATVDGMARTMAEQSIILEEIKSSLKSSNGRDKGVSVGSPLSGHASPLVQPSTGHIGSSQHSFAPVNGNPSFTPVFPQANVLPTMLPNQTFHSNAFTPVNQHNPVMVQYQVPFEAANNPNRASRIDFPVFEGFGSVKGWIFQCEQCFLKNGVLDEHRTQTSSVYVRGNALQWMEFYMHGRAGFPPWPDFCRDLCLRFDLTSYDKPVVEWKKVFQKGSVLEYQEEFEVAKARAMCDERFAIEMFIGGLKEEIQHVLINMNPLTLSQAFHAARVQEAYFNVIIKKSKATSALTWHKTPHLSITDSTHASRAPSWNRKNSTSSSNSQAGSSVRKSAKPLNDKDIEKRRLKGLCFWCDKKFVPGHKCSKRLYNLEVRIK